MLKLTRDRFQTFRKGKLVERQGRKATDLRLDHTVVCHSYGRRVAAERERLAINAGSRLASDPLIYWRQVREVDRISGRSKMTRVLHLEFTQSVSSALPLLPTSHSSGKTVSKRQSYVACFVGLQSVLISFCPLCMGIA